VGTRFSPRPDRPWGPTSLLYNGYRVFPGGKERPGRAANHSPPSSAAVMEEKSYTSIYPLGHTGPVTGSLYIYLYIRECSETIFYRTLSQIRSSHDIISDSFTVKYLYQYLTNLMHKICFTISFISCNFDLLMMSTCARNM